MDRSRAAACRIALRCSGILGFVAAWAALAAWSAAPVLPSPWAVARALGELAGKGLLMKYAIASLFRVTWGYSIAVVLAVPFGIMLGWHRAFGRACNPTVQILRPVSPLAWTPLAILWLGVGDGAAILIIFLGSFFPLVTITMRAVRGIAPTYVCAGRNFALSPWRFATRVLLPAAAPQLLAGMRLTAGIAWLVVVAAEMIAVNSGLGFLIIDARNAGDRYDLIVAGIATIGAIGFGIDVAMRRLERVGPVRWAYAATEAEA